MTAVSDGLEHGWAPPLDPSPGAADERAILYQIIRTVSSSVDLDEVLRGEGEATPQDRSTP